ncbi:DUF5985 family protein [Sphingomonas xinjiangensis]|uniref:Uncharacterized protein n=1 Tax=Sphingomonas xinjiangensis TaxID=643568 RepID=A0A840YCJ3_9SPHN|nr:DUF5985 family protein [Sphingomonas xinjiangensis]MBB5710015.1 hypothetical protein [Sphingomonas xinjiangensis]
MTAAVPAIVYLLCFGTSSVCAVLLGRSYRSTGMRFLFWSAICFTLLALNNLFVIVDLLVVRSIDLGLVRLILSLSAVCVLLFGFIWNMEEEA